MTQTVFNASGAFTPDPGVVSVDVLVVGGGGGGGSCNFLSGGGGGGGGVRWVPGVAVTPGVPVTVTVGAGGAATGTGNTIQVGGNGGNSEFAAAVPVVSLGGGGGGAGAGATRNGLAGGSGGGGGGDGAGQPVPTGGAGTAGQGNNGGNGKSTSTAANRFGGGGGGAGAVGGDGGSAGAPTFGGAGGAGVDMSANVGAGVGVAGLFGGGGGGACTHVTRFPGPAGSGGGGAGAGGNGAGATVPAAVGVANTGGGGGGGGANSGGGTLQPPKAGGSGVVIVVWVTPPAGDPENLSADPSETSIEFSWDAPSTGGPVDDYEVRIDGGAPTTATSPHDFTGLTAGTGYDLEVRANGPGGSSGWVLLEVDTTAPTEAGYYRVELTLGAHSWEVTSRDELDPTDPAGTVVLPLSLGWDIPDGGDYFPAQANLTTLGFAVRFPDADTASDIVKGTTVLMRMYVDADPDADPWQTFDGIATQLDGETVPGAADAEAPDFLVTVYAGDDNARLADMFVGYTDDWPIESISDRVARICDEAGIVTAPGLNGGAHGVGMAGWLAARTHGAAISAFDAIRTALKDAADDYDSEPPDEYYGRYVFGYIPWEFTLYVHVFRRRVFSTVTLDGGFVRASGRWSKQPGPAAADWVIVDGTTFGTPGAGIPLVRNTSLVDYFGPGGLDPNYSATERDNLGESLLADGSTALDGWASRSLRYEAARDDTANLPDTAMWASYAPPCVPVPVVVTPIGPDLELNGVDYVAGTLTAARLVIPPGGRFYIEFRLRAELLPGTDLP